MTQHIVASARKKLTTKERPTAPPVPTSEPRLKIVNGEFVEAGKGPNRPSASGTALPAQAAPPNSPSGYDRSKEIICPVCSHEGCEHAHLPYKRLTRVEAQEFLRYTENTLFTKHSRREMPAAISGPPLEFETCVLAVFKFDGALLARYERDAHLAALPVARAERARKTLEKSAKLSAHMRRRHAASRATKRTSRRGGAK